jgi:hypothetical protein
MNFCLSSEADDENTDALSDVATAVSFLRNGLSKQSSTPNFAFQNFTYGYMSHVGSKLSLQVPFHWLADVDVETDGDDDEVVDGSLFAFVCGLLMLGFGAGPRKLVVVVVGGVPVIVGTGSFPLDGIGEANSEWKMDGTDSVVPAALLLTWFG